MTTPTEIRLPSADYQELMKLVTWMEATPDRIELSESVLEQFWRASYDIVRQAVPDEISLTVETERGPSGVRLVAVIEDEEGNETRVPVLSQ